MSEGRDLFDAVAARVNNWGRWGDDDQLGTLNLIDGEARRRGARCVRRGAAFAMGLPLSAAEGIQLGFIPGRVNPTLTMTAVNDPLSDDPEWIASSEDKVELSMQCATHRGRRGSCEPITGGRMYNGHAASLVTDAGAAVCGIQQVATLVTRGILLDAARARGVDALEGGAPVGPDDLDAALALTGLTVEPGDVVLVRTGHMRWLRPGRRDLVKYMVPMPGLTMAAAAWFHARDVAAVATDTVSLEVYPCEYEDVYLPVHLLHLVEMGMTQGQNWDVDALAADCAADGVYEFLLDATPLPFTHALGSPVNPVAVK